MVSGTIGTSMRPETFSGPGPGVGPPSAGTSPRLLSLRRARHRVCARQDLTLSGRRHDLRTLNWQWAAGCGADAAPYFRIFNPETQAKRFDPKNEYIGSWIPREGYPKPVVDLKETREAALDAYVTMRRAKRAS